MIRYVHIGDQIEEDANQFAFYDTRLCSFVHLLDTTVFDNEADLREAWKHEPGDKPELDRLVGLIRDPDDQGPSPAPVVRNPDFDRKDGSSRCCNNEKRTSNGGCASCGDSCF